MAHKKGLGSTKNGRDSRAQRLGVKRFAGQEVTAGSILVRQHGTEGTPLLENNEGVTYGRKNNVDVRFSSEAFVGRYVSALVEPMFLYEDQGNFTQGRVNKGYVKLGGGGLELEVGRDANWLGLGDRGAITLTNNAVNFDLVKLSSPEPIDIRYIGALKYANIDAAGKHCLNERCLITNGQPRKEAVYPFCRCSQGGTISLPVAAAPLLENGWIHASELSASGNPLLRSSSLTPSSRRITFMKRSLWLR